MKIRKIVLTRETIYAEVDRTVSRPVNHAVAIAVIENPFAGRFVEDWGSLCSWPSTCWNAKLRAGFSGDLTPHGQAWILRELRNDVSYKGGLES
jgi:hypothetical protein